jgi:hypothetical protein
MAKITGRVEVLVNGQLLLSKTGATASGIGLSGKPAFKLKEVLGDTGLHGFVEEPVVAKCEVKVTDRDDVRLDTLCQINGDGTVIFRAAGGGKVYTMNNATCTRDLQVTAGEGETSLTFMGAYWTEAVQA